MSSLGTGVATDQGEWALAGVRWGGSEVLALQTLGVLWPVKVCFWGAVALAGVEVIPQEG